MDLEYDVVEVGSDDEVNLDENEDMKACQVYKSQIHRGRYLLHKHPWSASLWQKESKKMMLMQVKSLLLHLVKLIPKILFLMPLNKLLLILQ